MTTESFWVAGTRLWPFLICVLACWRETAAETVVPGEVNLLVEPADQTLYIGQKAVFRVQANSALTFTLQWFRNGVVIPGASAERLVVERVQPADAGIYMVELTSAGSKLSSHAATLVVRPAPPIEITRQPEDQVLLRGQQKGVEVVAESEASLSYQWQANGVDIPGQVYSKFSVSTALFPNGGELRALIRHDFGVAVTSRVARVTVAPFVIVSEPASRTSVPTGTVTFQAVLGGVLPNGHTFAWHRDGVLLPASRYPEQSATNLTLRDLSATDAGGYQVTIWSGPQDAPNVYSLTSRVARLTLKEPRPPVFHEAATGLEFTGLLTGRVSLHFDFFSEARISWQWFRQLTNAIPGATNQTLVLSGLTFRDAGDYTLVAANLAGKATSSVARVVINAPPKPGFMVQPVSQIAYLGGLARFETRIDSSVTYDAQWFFNRTNAIPGARYNNMALDQLSVANAGEYQLVVSNAGGAVTSQVARLTVVMPQPPVFSRQPKSQTAYLGGSVGFDGHAPLATCYEWFFNGTNRIANGNDWPLWIENLSTADAGDYTLVAINASGRATSQVARLAVAAPPAPTIARPPASQIVTSGDAVSLTVMIDSAVPARFQWRVNGQPLANEVAQSLVLKPVSMWQAGDYDVVVTTTGGIVISDAATITVNRPTPPEIESQPASRYAAVGEEVSFSVAAHSHALMNYQWWFEGKTIGGATNASLVMGAIQLSQAGDYFVVAGNDGGTVTSRVARLTVLPAAGPEITRQPAGLITRAGEEARLSVDVQGSPPLGFQWRRDGRDLAGATSQMLTLPYARPFEAGDYAVVVANRSGAVTSRVARVEVTSAVANRRRADVDGDGHNDLVFQHLDGSVGFWHMDGARLVRGSLLSHRLPAGYKWRVIGMDQAKQDGHPDLLLESAGVPLQLVVWNLDGTNLLRGVPIFTTTGSDWQAVSFRDFDGDGSPDILRQFVFQVFEPPHYWSSRRGVYWLKLNGVSAAVPENHVVTAGSNFHWWVVAGAGDLDGDGKVDVVVRSTTGELGVWFQRQGQYAPQTGLAPGWLETEWELRAIVDLDGDGKDDLVFQHREGKLLAWFMNSWHLDRSAYLEPAVPGDGWELVGPK